ncbi:MAG: hypothetical protein H7Z13_09510 [Ferruginibacter sp.]|nr:hypothetical protein [Ferruginibacter sp.]
MTQTYLYTATAFIAGFITAWIIRTITLVKIKKMKKSADGYLESEKLMKEKLQKENILLHQNKQSAESELEKKLKDAERLIRILDEDILLLQKSNEETEALLLAGQPALHELKRKLVEAQNTIARFKGQAELKETN